MTVAVITGSAGLIGSETCKRFHAEGCDIVGVDNDMRAKFFGAAVVQLDRKDHLGGTAEQFAKLLDRVTLPGARVQNSNLASGGIQE